MNITSYFANLEKEVQKNYKVAGEARAKGYDPSLEVEVPVATSLAERVVGLISVLYPQVRETKISERVLELEKIYGPLDPAVALTIAEEVAKEKFCKFSTHHEAIEAGIRFAIGYLTLGYVSSPIEGFIQLKVKKTADGKDYFAPYYSGPIRSAGGTEAAFSLVVVDYLREMFGFARYDPTDDEAKRGTHECYEYHERITNLQYLPSEKELDFLLKNVPVQISGDPSEDKEVYNYKDLPRIETNFIRSGFCLVTGEGLAQKAPKILKRVAALREKGFKLSDWDWLDKFVKLQKELKEDKKADASRAGATYIQDLVAGRPVFAHPSYSGSFRLRYGRCRNTGYSTLALHPATMGVTRGFIALGTQLKIEKPTKGCTIASCDSIDGPIVLLQDGSVKYIGSYEESLKLSKDIKEILYLGDMLVPYGDFFNRNHYLEPAGYVPQYWLEQLKSVGAEGNFEGKVDFDKAIALSREFKVPLHPDYIYFWREIDIDKFYSLIDWIARATIRNGHLILSYTKEDRERFAQGKRALELIGCEHEVSIENVVLSEKDSRALLFNLGLDISKNYESLSLDRFVDDIGGKIKAEGSDMRTGLDAVRKLCSLEIRDKSGTFIGARMGRPEKAKLRKLTGSPHVLFPVGDEGGRLRSFQAAIEKGFVNAEFPIYYCNDCHKDNVYPKCLTCGKLCVKSNYCMKCDKEYSGTCPEHGNISEFRRRNVDVASYFEHARRSLGLRNEELPVIKGVRGTSSKDHSCEPLVKGLLRARHNLHVNKDGTIRYDMTEMPITHFKPLEIGTSVQKLKDLGYEQDYLGNALERDDQIIEIFPHDIILPSCPDTPDEKADDVFIKVSQFVDDELEKIYGLPKFFNATKREDIVGVFLGCMSPHTSAVVVGRLIGFSNAQALLSSPYIHAAMRRDCDGDEAAVMLLMDLLLNFSRKFIPAHRGGTQDAPLVLNMRIRANEVDDMIFDVDTSSNLPLALYEAARDKKHPSSVKMEQVKARLGGDREFTGIGFSYGCSNINSGPSCSSYKTLPTMQEKVSEMMELCKKIRAVDVNDVARLIIERHFIRDIRGNLRKFSMQVFRCVDCNEKFRRPPLTGKCLKCGGKLIFTISEGSIIKYLAAALDLARTYSVSPYLLESLEVTEKDIEGIFGREKEKQEQLRKWFG